MSHSTIFLHLEGGRSFHVKWANGDNLSTVAIRERDMEVHMFMKPEAMVALRDAITDFIEHGPKDYAEQERQEDLARIAQRLERDGIIPPKESPDVIV